MNTKLLALKRLGIEPHSNSVRTSPKKCIELRGVKQGSKFEGFRCEGVRVREVSYIANRTSNWSSPAARHAYQFKLKNGEGGGTYICDTPDLEEARDNLLKRYGRRLLAMTKIGGKTCPAQS